LGEKHHGNDQRTLGIIPLIGSAAIWDNGNLGLDKTSCASGDSSKSVMCNDALWEMIKLCNNPVSVAADAIAGETNHAAYLPKVIDASYNPPNQADMFGPNFKDKGDKFRARMELVKNWLLDAPAGDFTGVRSSNEQLLKKKLTIVFCHGGVIKALMAKMGELIFTSQCKCGDQPDCHCTSVNVPRNKKLRESGLVVLNWNANRYEYVGDFLPNIFNDADKRSGGGNIYSQRETQLSVANKYELTKTVDPGIAYLGKRCATVSDIIQFAIGGAEFSTAWSDAIGSTGAIIASKAISGAAEANVSPGILRQKSEADLSSLDHIAYVIQIGSTPNAVRAIWEDTCEMTMGHCVSHTANEYQHKCKILGFKGKWTTCSTFAKKAHSENTFSNSKKWSYVYVKSALPAAACTLQVSVGTPFNSLQQSKHILLFSYSILFLGAIGIGRFLLVQNQKDAELKRSLLVANEI